MAQNGSLQETRLFQIIHMVAERGLIRILFDLVGARIGHQHYGLVLYMARRKIIEFM